jgi:hypothetical protein
VPQTQKKILPADHKRTAEMARSFDKGLAGGNSEVGQAVEIPPVDSHNKDGDDSSATAVAVDGTGLNEVNATAQIGVQEMEATTLTWTKPSLACLFIG